MVLTLQKSLQKNKNGASLIQLYTGLVYKGPKLITEINKGSLNLLKKMDLIILGMGVEVN